MKQEIERHKLNNGMVILGERMEGVWAVELGIRNDELRIIIWVKAICRGRRG